MSSLLGQNLGVINLGLDSFADVIEAEGGRAARVDWRPPAGGPETAAALAKLVDNPAVEAANQQAFDRYLASQPVLEGIGIAGKTLPGMGRRHILHAGPPIEWERMAAPVKGAVVGAILIEGWADTEGAALDLAAGGEIAFEPCHHFDAVGPMAGIISPSMPVVIVRDAVSGTRTYSNLNEGLGKVLRYGAYSGEVLDRLRWIGGTLAPVISKALEKTGEIELKPLMAQAMHMGDEGHNRNVAGSALFLKTIIAAALNSDSSREDVAASADFIAGNILFFLNISMAACKCMLNAAHGVEGSSMATVMARNGVEFGLRVSGLGDQWFTAVVEPADGLFFAGYSRDDAAPDLGDSAITETAGIGGFAMAAAPAIVQFVGGTSVTAINATNEMTHVTIGRNPAFTIPSLDFAGSPAGIDARKVVGTNTPPVINTGIAHKEAGIGQIGAGITHAPMACFEKAVIALADTIK